MPQNKLEQELVQRELNKMPIGEATNPTMSANNPNRKSYLLGLDELQQIPLEKRREYLQKKTDALNTRSDINLSDEQKGKYG